MKITATIRTTAAAMALTSLLCVSPTRAATPPTANVEGDRGADSLLFQSSGYIRDLIERAQRALTTLGLYDGPISGEVGPLLVDAIEQFQRRDGRLGNTIIDEALVERLEASVNIGALLGRLNEARQRDITAAREKLLANPETRGLIEQNRAAEPADATRDAAACFAAPDAVCLLREATESARAVSTPGRRDWALGEVLVAQVLTGQSDDALQTAASMSDPRLIMVALRRIAEAEAAAGRPSAAVSALDMIPDATEQQTARIDVARALSRIGEHTAALQSSSLLLGEKADTAALALNGGAGLATVLHAAGNSIEAETWLARLTLRVREMEAGENRDAGYKAAANAYLAIGRPDVALALLERIESTSQRNAVHIEAARYLAALGRIDEATTMAEAVDGDRYKALAFADMADALLEIDQARAAKALDRASAVAADIRLPFARDFAMSRIALVKAALDNADHDAVRSIAVDIRDQELRAETLWQLSLRYAGVYEAAAEKAVDDIEGDFNAAWLMAGLADQAESDDAAGARTLLQRALTMAEQVKTPWARARLLAKIATVTHRIDG